MCNKIIALLLFGAPLFGAPESIALQDLRITIDCLTRELNHFKVDMGLLQERLSAIESPRDGDQNKAPSSFERRIAALEKAQDALISDFKTLKNHLNEALASLTKCDSKVSNLEGALFTDLKSLKSVLHSLSGSTGQYIVKPGDSLGQIALEHKTDIRTLKQLNNLSSDTIYAGQKLTLP